MSKTLPLENSANKRRDYLLATIVFLLASVWLVYFVQGKPGLEPDGANALHIAQNVAAGEGIVGKYANLSATTLAPTPTITKPPLFALVLGALIKAGISSEMAGGIVVAVSSSIALALLYLIARQALPASYALFVPAFAAFQVTTLNWGITIHEEALFVALALATLWRLSFIARTNGSIQWSEYALVGGLAALAMLASYQGLPLVIIAFVYALMPSFRSGNHKPLAALVIAMAAVGAWPFLRFVGAWMAGVRPGLDTAGETVFYQMLAGIVSAVQNDVFGRQIVWLYDGSLSDIALVSAFYILVAGLLAYGAWRCRSLRPLAVFTALYLAMLVAQLGGQGKDIFEPRYNLPIYGILFLFTIYAIDRLTNAIAKKSAGLLALVLLLPVFIYAQSSRYPTLLKNHGPICSAPATIAWIKGNISSGSVVAATECGYQLIAESSAYYWLSIPPAQDALNPVRWNESDLLSACKFGDRLWIALFDGERKDPFREKPGYGPYIDQLFGGKPSARLELVGRTADGLIYRVQCGAASASSGAPG